MVAIRALLNENILNDVSNLAGPGLYLSNIFFKNKKSPISPVKPLHQFRSSQSAIWMHVSGSAELVMFELPCDERGS